MLNYYKEKGKVVESKLFESDSETLKILFEFRPSHGQEVKKAIKQQRIS